QAVLTLPTRLESKPWHSRSCPVILPSRHPFRLALLPLLLVAGALAAQEPSPPVQRGQTAAEVRQRLGPPVRVSRQILFRRPLEQWHYDAPRPLRVEFNCVRGEEPYVCSVLQLSPSRP